MSGFKGTPGPWEIDRYGTIVHGSKNGFGRKETVMVSGVAIPGRTTLEYAANSNLVAAAPELLEALISARKELEGNEQELTGEAYNNPAINSAINKALGVIDE